MFENRVINLPESAFPQKRQPKTEEIWTLLQLTFLCLFNMIDKRNYGEFCGNREFRLKIRQ